MVRKFTLQHTAGGRQEGGGGGAVRRAAGHQSVLVHSRGGTAATDQQTAGLGSGDIDARCWHHDGVRTAALSPSAISGHHANSCANWLAVLSPLWLFPTFHSRPHLNLVPSCCSCRPSIRWAVAFCMPVMPHTSRALS
jgi:hypothetical protein